MTLRSAVLPSVVTVAGLVVTVALVAAVTRVAGALVLAGLLAISLARSRLVETWRGRLEGLVGLPLVALTTAATGTLLLAVPVAGAAAFTAAMFCSVWLRRFGPRCSRIGGLIALPFITLLVAPVRPGEVGPLSVALISLAAFGVVVALRVLADAVGVRQAGDGAPAPPARPSSLRPVASTRMALQLAVALVAGWAAGFLLFPQHAAWVVLTAYLVHSRNRGRADVLHTGVLRLGGALLGAAVASAVGLIPHWHLDGASTTLAVLAVLAVGIWLRNASYAWWAAAVTLVVTLIQDAQGGPADPVPRLLAILTGAVLGVTAAWFVLPVRSSGVLRRRIADAFAALDAWLADPTAEGERDLDAALHRLREVQAPFRAAARLNRLHAGPARPGVWARDALELVARARGLPDGSRAEGRRALAGARRALREPAELGQALAVASAALPPVEAAPERRRRGRIES